jgi:two-component system, LytTR family, sensor histidine kinase AlgZ
MHPIFSRRAWLAAYLAGAGSGAVLLALLLRVAGGLSWAAAGELAGPLAFLYAFVCLTPWYLCRMLPLGATYPAKIAVEHLGSAVLATGLWVAAAQGLGRIFAIGAGTQAVIPYLTAVGLLLYCLSVALHYMLLAMQASREAAVQARDAELRALKAQVNPHFLFNSLNSIAALAVKDPPQAREMCILLSDFLRRTLGLGERESISWAEEIQLVSAYLDIERIRFGTRLHVEMQIDGACGECQVPPLLLQPLVENAVKHGIATMVDGGTIRVNSRLEEGLLQVFVENGYDAEAPAPRRQGLGLRNVRNRLETSFGGAARLTTQIENSVFRTEMILPCQTAR